MKNRVCELTTREEMKDTRDITLKLLDSGGNIVEQDKILPQSGRYYFSEPMKILVDRAENVHKLGDYQVVMEVRNQTQ